MPGVARKNWLLSLIEAPGLALAYGLAFLLRFEGQIPPAMTQVFEITLPLVLLLQSAALIVFGVHRISWRHVGLPDVRRIGASILATAALLLGARLVLGALDAQRFTVPIGVIMSDAVFAFLAVAGVRVGYRMMAERSEHPLPSADARVVRTIVIGAGRVGAMLTRELLAQRALAIEPIGFVDDDASLVGVTIHGLPVLGTTARLAELCAGHGATSVLIALEDASQSEIRRIVDLCTDTSVLVKIVPNMAEIVRGRLDGSAIRAVAIEDLLGRDPVDLDTQAIGGVIGARTVLVSGAGGSIGSELCRQICRYRPEVLVLVENSENNLFHIERELRARFPEARLVACMASVGDEPRIDAIFAKYRPSVVLHAAAYKHVPMMEANTGEAVRNNVFGTKVLADTAARYGASKFVMISTDKAVNPTSVMGVSKRLAEIYVQALASRGKTHFVVVRFGNVLGSAGSVVPIFQEQIARGGPVTITHPDMRRYFMTAREACGLVLQAAAMGEGGEIFVLDMGTPIKIVDLATEMIKLSGLRAGEDIKIEFTGVRPGEKLYEDFSTDDERAVRTRHRKIFIGRIAQHPVDQVGRWIGELAAVGAGGDDRQIRATFKRMVPEYTPDPRYGDPTPEQSPEAQIDALAAKADEISLQAS